MPPPRFVVVHETWGYSLQAITPDETSHTMSPIPFLTMTLQRAVLALALAGLAAAALAAPEIKHVVVVVMENR